MSYAINTATTGVVAVARPEPMTAVHYLAVGRASRTPSPTFSDTRSTSGHQLRMQHPV